MSIYQEILFSVEWNKINNKKIQTILSTINIHNNRICILFTIRNIVLSKNESKIYVLLFYWFMIEFRTRKHIYIYISNNHLFYQILKTKNYRSNYQKERSINYSLNALYCKEISIPKWVNSDCFYMVLTHLGLEASIYCIYPYTFYL